MKKIILKHIDLLLSRACWMNQDEFELRKWHVNDTRWVGLTMQPALFHFHCSKKDGWLVGSHSLASHTSPMRQGREWPSIHFFDGLCGFFSLLLLS
jgi:hypothetical protein